jgi:hypothetical protein
MKNKIKRGFLPIYSKDIRRLIDINSKYVAEQDGKNKY